jgi:hypothetical protein
MHVFRAEAGEKKEKYKIIQEKFGASMGLAPPQMEKLKYDMYYGQIRNIVRAALNTKGNSYLPYPCSFVFDCMSVSWYFV